MLDPQDTQCLEVTRRQVLGAGSDRAGSREWRLKWTCRLSWASAPARFRRSLPRSALLGSSLPLSNNVMYPKLQAE